MENKNQNKRVEVNAKFGFSNYSITYIFSLSLFSHESIYHISKGDSIEPIRIEIFFLQIINNFIGILF